MILEPLGLKDTFYANGPHPGPAAAGPVLSRVPRALFLLEDCLDDPPQPCRVSTVAPLIGKDMRMGNLSWAGAGGAIISNPRGLGSWIRALFGGRVIPAQQFEVLSCEGETLGFRTIFAYWPQFDLLITGSVNSRPPDGEDKFGPAVIGGAFMALQEAGLPNSASKPAAK